MKTYAGVQVELHVFLTLAMGWGEYSTPAISPWGKSSRYPLDRRLGELQSLFRRYGEKSPAPAGNRTPIQSPILMF
jgi:hypothetical protein